MDSWSLDLLTETACGRLWGTAPIAALWGNGGEWEGRTLGPMVQ